MPGHYNRTDLMDTSRLPGEAAAETQGEASRRAGVVSETPSPRPARPPVVRRSERPDEPVQAGLPIGPGPGRRAMPQSRSETFIDDLQAILRRTKDPQLAILLGRIMERR